MAHPDLLNVFLVRDISWGQMSAETLAGVYNGAPDAEANEAQGGPEAPEAEAQACSKT